MKTFSITFFRHGRSAYRQGNVPIAWFDANDLANGAEQEIRESVGKILPSLHREHFVDLKFSPVGRAVHTARVISQEVERSGRTLGSWSPSCELGEVANFSWDYFEPLMNGGKVVLHDADEPFEFEVKKSETNPTNLGYPDYFITDSVHEIPSEVSAQWPRIYAERVARFERFADVTRRGLTLIKSIADHNHTGHFILVGHDGMAMYLAGKFTGGRQKGLTPASFISIDRTDDGKLVVTQVGDITDGDSKTDFINKFLSTH